LQIKKFEVKTVRQSEPAKSVPAKKMGWKNPPNLLT